MRLLAVLLASIALAPAALAIQGPPGQVGGDVGPCHASQTLMVDNTFTTATCAAEGVEAFYVRAGSGFAGGQCTVRVLGVALDDCQDALLP